MFGRRTTPESPNVPEVSLGSTAAGKGRPTPTRKEAEAARKSRMTTPRTRKEQAAARRAKTQAFRERQKQALLTGDDAYLPARDKGPVKRYARDYVDSRWCVGEVLLPLFFLVFVAMTVAPQIAAFASTAWLVVITLMVLDGIRIVRGVKAGVRAKFGEDETKGIATYAVMRAMQMRRLRLPKPTVKHGASV